ncbi:MAG: hypothetical protein KAR39_12925 [Thermoplasmata archaeon]|nr:hypothetical protein [Thermoplasmata archaeon]
MDFHELVQTLDENEIISLHHELVSRNIYNNLVDLTDVGDDLTRLKNIVPIALQRLNYEDIRQIAPEKIKKAISSFIESETITSEIPEPPDEIIQPQPLVESREQDIEEIKNRLGIITSERGTNNRILPEFRDEVLELTTKLNKVYGIPVKDIAKFTNMSMPSVSRNVKDFMNKHPYEEHRWLAAAEKKAIVKADDTLTKAAGKKADELVETYLSLGQWTIETYTLMAHSLGMSVRELVELGVDSYNPSIHIELLEFQKEKDEYKLLSNQMASYIYSQDMRIQELEMIIINIMKQLNPDSANIIEKYHQSEVIN